jgi:hypothetical protein
MIPPLRSATVGMTDGEEKTLRPRYRKTEPGAPGGESRTILRLVEIAEGPDARCAHRGPCHYRYNVLLGGKLFKQMDIGQQESRFGDEWPRLELADALAVELRVLQQVEHSRGEDIAREGDVG